MRGSWHDPGVDPCYRGKPSEIDKKWQGKTTSVPTEDFQIHKDIGQQRAIAGGKKDKQVNPGLRTGQYVEVDGKIQCPSQGWEQGHRTKSEGTHIQPIKGIDGRIGQDYGDTCCTTEGNGIDGVLPKVGFGYDKDKGQTNDGSIDRVNEVRWHVSYPFLFYSPRGIHCTLKKYHPIQW